MSELPPLDFEKNVFINCPFDDKYLELLHPNLFALIYLGFSPRIASERSDSGEQRIDKICELIGESKYSIHDLSRLQSKKKKEYFRLNMPFEMGIDYGIRKFGKGCYQEKKFLILSKARFDYAKAISDLSGVDIKSHEEEAIKVIRAVRNWLKQYMPGTIPAPQVIWEQFNYFMEDFHDKRKDEGFSDDDIYEITSSQLGEFVEYIEEWIRQKRNPLGPGLGSKAAIIDGSYHYTSSTLLDEAVKDYNFTIKSGQITRNRNGKLTADMTMRSPSVLVQKIIERSGGDKETFESNDSELSIDSANPTEFRAFSELTYHRGDEIVVGKVLDADISFRISTILKGYLHNGHFTGTYDADWIASTSADSFQASGEFDVELR